MSETNETIAKKLSRLQVLVTWFESDEFVLEESIEHFKEAEELADEIEHDLSALKNEVVVLKKRFDEE